jgi:hypothetical protein
MPLRDFELREYKYRKNSRKKTLLRLPYTNLKKQLNESLIKSRGKFTRLDEGVQRKSKNLLKYSTFHKEMRAYSIKTILLQRLDLVFKEGITDTYYVFWKCSHL